MKRLSFAVFGVVSGLILSGCNTGSMVSTDQEIAVGRQSAQEVESQYRVISGTSDAREIQAIGARLAAVRTRRDITYQFKLIRNTEVNAFALPGGWIYVDSGLMDLLNKSSVPGGYPGNLTKTDMLAGVLAHEMGHVEARHQAKMMGRSEIYGVALATLGNSNTQQWASVFANINLLQYSRADENEADALGVKYAAESGYNPYGLVAFLDLLNKTSGGGGGPAFLRTHPSTPERLERTRKLAAQYK